MAVRAPDKLLTVPELVAYTGFARQTICKMMQDPRVWAKPGGAKLIHGEYRLPTAFYNRWVDGQDVAPASIRKEVRDAA